MKNIFTHPKIAEHADIDASEVPFNPEAVAYCKANLCGKYGKTWNCPPAVGTYENLKKHALSFKRAFVFTHKGTIEDFSDTKAMDMLRNETLSILSDICAKIKQKNIPYLSLGCGGCNECSKCTYPDAPCRFPEKAVPPVEAYGVDVALLAQKTGMTYYAGKNTVTFFCVIFYS